MAKEKKAYSLDAAVIAAVEREAKLLGIYPSLYVNDALREAVNAADAKRLGQALREEGDSDA